MSHHIAFRILSAVTLLISLTGVATAAPSAPEAKRESDSKPLRSEALAAFPAVTAPDPFVLAMVEQVNQEMVRTYVGDLSGEWPAGVGGGSYEILTRHMNQTVSIQKATLYAGEHFAGLGLDVEYHVWGPPTAPNVIGEKTGSTRPGDIFMVTAHLDDLPAGDAAPGADDNASGSAAVLITADVLSQYNWDCTLRFALWTGEEQGLLGSAAYAERANEDGENILGVFNLDMIGWNSPESPPDIDLHADGTRPATVDLANQAATVIDAYDLDLIPEVRADGTGFSDQASFWDQGYTAILGIEDYYPNEHDVNPDYHTTDDKLSGLDLGYLTEYVKAVVAETAHMAGCLTPSELQGQVVSAHDNSPIVGAEIELQGGAGHEYVAYSSAGGVYRQPVLPGIYSVTVSAYGYGPSTAAGITVAANNRSTQDFALLALPPTSPRVSIALDSGEVKLGWLHRAPNTAYQVRRSSKPDFSPGNGVVVATLDASHPPAPGETLSLRVVDSGSGDAATNDFYVVLGMNAAGASAESGRTGEFDFALTPTAGR